MAIQKIVGLPAFPWIASHTLAMTMAVCDGQLPRERIAETVAVARDAACGGVWKMDRQDKRARVRDLAQKPSPRLRRRLWVEVENRRPVRLAALQRVVHQVARHDRLLAL